MDRGEALVVVERVLHGFYIWHVWSETIEIYKGRPDLQPGKETEMFTFIQYITPSKTR